MTKDDIIYAFFGFLAVFVGSVYGLYDTEDDLFAAGAFISFILVPIFGFMWIQASINDKKTQKELIKKEQDDKEKAENTKSKLSILSFFGKTKQYQIYDDLVFEITNWGAKTTKYIRLYCTNYNCVDDKINDFVYECQGFIGSGTKGRFEFSVNNRLVSYYMLNKVSIVYSDGSVEDFDGKDVHFGKL